MYLCSAVSSQASTFSLHLGIQEVARGHAVTRDVQYRKGAVSLGLEGGVRVDLGSTIPTRSCLKILHRGQARQISPSLPLSPHRGDTREHSVRSSRTETHSIPSGQHPRKQSIVIGKNDSSYPHVCAGRRTGWTGEGRVAAE